MSECGSYIRCYLVGPILMFASLYVCATPVQRSEPSSFYTQCTIDVDKSPDSNRVWIVDR